MRAASGLVRIVHPFPSVANAVVVGAIAYIAGAVGSAPLWLGLGMLFLQFAIGILNDLADAPFDALVKPQKPIPANLLSVSQARLALLVSVVTGLAAAASVGPRALLIGLVGLGDGFVYDLRLKGTPLSWLPLTAGVVLVPVYGWWAATGSWPAAMWGVVALAAPAGLSLSVANALADLERDRRSGVQSVARALGRRAAYALDLALTASVQAIVLLTVVRLGSPIAHAALCLPGLAGGWIGLALSARAGERAQQAGWEAQLLGLVLLGTAWLALLGQAGALAN